MWWETSVTICDHVWGSPSWKNRCCHLGSMMVYLFHTFHTMFVRFPISWTMARLQLPPGTTYRARPTKWRPAHQPRPKRSRCWSTHRPVHELVAVWILTKKWLSPKTADLDWVGAVWNILPQRKENQWKSAKVIQGTHLRLWWHFCAMPKAKDINRGPTPSQSARPRRSSVTPAPSQGLPCCRKAPSSAEKRSCNVQKKLRTWTNANVCGGAQ